MPNSFLLIFGGAFLGGLILNIMPCVLPVLALKLHAMGQPSPLSKRQQAGWLTLGLFLFFFAFALLIYLLQWSGQQVGWGFHFQQPIFIIVMMAVLLFLIRVQMGHHHTGFGFIQHATNQTLNYFSPARRSYHLLHGGLITLLATPCTAPFLGGAVAFALTQSLPMLLAVFMMIALGLAFPWIVLYFIPNKIATLISLTRLGDTRRGKIARLTSIIFMTMLYATILWLGWVLSAQLGWTFAIAVFILIHLAIWFLTDLFSASIRMVAASLLVATIITPVFYRPTAPLSPPLSVQSSDLVWHAFDERQLHEQVQRGKIVFVDITADWCLSCQYNKTHILSDEAIRQRFAQKDIYLMRGDWTNPDPVITVFLKSQNRVGVPFNAIYHRGGKKIFSEILDKENLLASLQ